SDDRLSGVATIRLFSGANTLDIQIFVSQLCRHKIAEEVDLNSRTQYCIRFLCQRNTDSHKDELDVLRSPPTHAVTHTRSDNIRIHARCFRRLCNPAKDLSIQVRCKAHPPNL